MKKIQYETIEVPAQDEKYYVGQGWEKYGMRGDRDLRFVKLRRVVNEKRSHEN